MGQEELFLMPYTIAHQFFCRAPRLLLAASLLAGACFAADNGPRVRLQLELKGSRYCSSDIETDLLSLNYVFRFVNESSQPIIISKDAGTVLAILAAHDRSGLEGPTQEHRISVTTMYSEGGQPLDSPRPGPEVITLQPARSFAVRRTVSITLERNATSPHAFTPGGYLLQVLVRTWDDSDELARRQRERWKKWGYLWTDPIKSEPTPIKIEAQRSAPSCE